MDLDAWKPLEAVSRLASLAFRRVGPTAPTVKGVLLVLLCSVV